MSKTTSRKKKRQAKKRSLMMPLVLGTLVIFALIAGAVALRNHLTDQQSQTTSPTLAPNVYTAEDFTYDGGYLACTAGDYALGIDVSSHQQEIDWQQVKDAGMEFVFVRIGYRGYCEGVLHIDELAAQNLAQAKAAGLQVGAYFYSQALNEKEALEEAELCLDFLEDYKLDLPVVFDWEYVSETARTANMDADTLTQCAQAFCKAVEDAGYEAMIYANTSQARDLYHMTRLQEYPFWLAMYSDTMDYPYRIDFWQYTETGSVPGITGNVDINLMFCY